MARRTAKGGVSASQDYMTANGIDGDAYQITHCLYGSIDSSKDFKISWQPLYLKIDDDIRRDRFMNQRL